MGEKWGKGGREKEERREEGKGGKGEKRPSLVVLKNMNDHRLPHE